MSVMRKVRNIYTYSQLLLFSNRMGYLSNLIHMMYSARVRVSSLLKRKRYASDSDIIHEAVKNLHTKGYCLIESDDIEKVEAIRNGVDSVFSDDEFCVNTLKARGLIRMRDSFCNVPDIDYYLGLADSYIKEYYLANYRIFSSDIYRTMQKNEDEKGFDSDLYHLDNGPRSTLKMMVYLTDVTKETGGITVIPKDKSRSMIKRGFWDRFKADKYMEELDANARVIEARKGTIILFTPQYCIHKATLPEKEHRDVAVFLIYPGLEGSVLSDSYRKQCSNYYGYLKNPFSWKPMRVGDE